MRVATKMVIALLLVAGSCFAFQPPDKPPKESPNKAATAKIMGSVIQLADEPVIKLKIKAKADGRNPSKTELEAHQKALKAVQQKLKSVLKEQLPNAKIRREFTYLTNGIAVDVAPEELQKKLGKLSYVRSISPDREFTAYTSQSVPLIGAPAVWATQDGLGRNVTGQGVVISIVDSGIDYNHPDLGGGFGPSHKVIGGYDFANGDSDPLDDMGHGTHVAGIAAGTGAASGGQYKGVAPDARLMAFKVLNAAGSGYLSDIMAGIEASCNPDGNIFTDDAVDVINLSLGTADSFGGDLCEPVCGVVANAVHSGVTVVAASGNSAWNAWYYYSIGGAPANCMDAITVGASDRLDDMAWFSSCGPVRTGTSCEWGLPPDAYEYRVKPDVVAPGVDIVSTRAAGTDIYGDGIHIVDDHYYRANGTSMACPHVAGVAALLIQIHPDYTPEQIKALVCERATDIDRSPYIQGSGRVQVDASAISQTIVNPTAVSLQYDTGATTPYEDSETIYITNKSASQRTYGLSVDMHPYAGVTAALSTSSLMLAPGATGSFTINLSIDEQVAGDHGFYGAVMVSAGPEQNRVPFAVVSGSLTPARDTSDSGLEDLWPIDLNGAVRSHVSVADVDSDWYYETLIGTDNGYLYLIDRFGKPFANWPVSTGAPITAPASAEDINLDGDVEVVAVSNGRIWAWNLDGTPAAGWPVVTTVSSLSASAMSDIDGDNAIELFVAGGTSNCIRGFAGDGTALPGWPFNTTGEAIATPAIGNLDADPDSEIVAGDAAGNVYVVNSNGTIAAGWPQSVGGPVVAPPVLADVDRDGQREIIVCSETGNVYVWNGDGSPLSGWPQTGAGRIWASPAAAEIDADGQVEIVVLSTQGSMHVWHADGTPVAGSPYPATSPISQQDTSRIQASPVLWNVDYGDALDVVIAGRDGWIRILSYDSGASSFAELYAYTRYTNSPIHSTPVICDMEMSIPYSDMYTPAAELIVGTSSGRVHMWRVLAADWVWGETMSPWSMFGGDPWHSGKWEGRRSLATWMDSGYQPSDIYANGRDTAWVSAYLVDRFGGTVTEYPHGVTMHVSSPTGSITPTGTVVTTNQDSWLGNFRQMFTATTSPGSATIDVVSPNLQTVQHVLTIHGCFPNEPNTPIMLPGAATPIRYADMDGNGTQDLVVRGYNGSQTSMHVLKPDGSGEVGGWPITASASILNFAIADLDSDDQPEVVWSTYDWRVHAYDRDGTALTGWPILLPAGTDTAKYYVTPVLADIVGDRAPEVLVCNGNQLFVYDASGQIVSGFPVNCNGYQPSVGDIDGDGANEIVIGIDSSMNVTAFNNDGTVVAGWPKAVSDQVIGDNAYSRPTLGDIDSDGIVEVVFPSRHNEAVFAWNGDGTAVPGWPASIPGALYNTAVWLADVDGCGNLEVICDGRFLNAPMHRYEAGTYIFRGDGTKLPGCPDDGLEGAPGAIADVDGNSTPDIVTCDDDGIYYAYSGGSTLIPGWPYVTRYRSTPTVADFDNDGTVEVAAVGQNNTGTNGYYIALWSCQAPSLAAPWPVTGQNMGNTNCLPAGKFAITASGSELGSPALADLDGDGTDETIIGSLDGKVHIFYANGQEYPLWPMSVDGPIYDAPAVGDIDSDGVKEIVVATRGTATTNGSLYALDLEGFVIGGWPKTDMWSSSSPVLANIDGDSYLEVLLGSETGAVKAFNHDGTPVANWNGGIIDPVSSTPAVGDIDGDGAPEIAAGDVAGCIMVWNGDGSPLAGWPAFPGRQVGGMILASPALVDLNNDGKLEIIICTEYGRVYAFNQTGVELSGWPVNLGANTLASPAIGDLNGDGSPDIIVAAQDGKVHALTAAGTPVSGWTVPQRPAAVPRSLVYLESSPLLADINGDGALEVVVGWFDGKVYAYNNTGTLIPGWPKIAGGPLAETPAIGDVDGDGSWDVVIGSSDGSVYRWETGGNAADTSCLRFPWVSFHGNTNRTGVYTCNTFKNTQLVVSPASGKVGDWIPLSAVLTRTRDNQPVNGKTVRFSVGGTFIGNATTWGNGTATLYYQIPAGTTTRTITAQFVGDASYDASSGQATLTVTRLFRVKWDSPGPTFNGLTWNTAYHSVQAAINAAAAGDEVWVAGATEAQRQQNPNAGKYAECITHKAGVKLLGGYAGTDAFRDAEVYASILDGSSGWNSVVTVPTGAGRSTLIDGFTITGGYSMEGGGILCYGSAPTISHNIITGNSCDFTAGGCGKGGGIYCSGLDALIQDNTIIDNDAQDGGAICLWSCSPTIINNVIVRNHAIFDFWEAGYGGYGGAIYCFDSSPVLTNNTIADNAADIEGGALYCNYYGDGCEPELVNNIIAFNNSGLYADTGSAPTLSYNDVYGNTAYNFSGMTDPTGSNGNISADPAFVNRQSNDYRLSGTSACIEAGTDDGAPTTDRDGDSRPADGNGDGFAGFDIGAYEYRLGIWQGSGSSALADLDGDGSDEAVAGSIDGEVHVIKANGTEMTGWPQTVAGPVVDAPAVADIDGDNYLEIVVTTEDNGSGGKVYAFERDGTLMPGWPQGDYDTDVYSAPAISDIDGDGLQEIVVGCYWKAMAFNHDGTAVTGWPFYLYDCAVATPAIGNIDDDPAPEVIVGEWCGLLWAINSDGTRVSTWPVEPGLPSGVVISSPVLANLDTDSKLEVIACGDDGKVYAFNEDMTSLPGWPITLDTSGMWASPAVGDLNSDGAVDIVFAGRSGKVYALTAAGTPTPGWQVPNMGSGSPTDYYSNVQSSPLLADVDGDGDVEVIIGSYGGQVYAFNPDGSNVTGWPKATNAPLTATAAIGNMDGDSQWDVVIGSGGNDIFRWEIAGNTASKPCRLFPWTTFHGNNLRTGAYTCGQSNGTYIKVPGVSGAVGSTVYLMPSLWNADAGTPITNKQLTVKVDGVLVGTTSTQWNGTAWLMYTIPSGADHREVTVEFAGDATYRPSSEAGALDILTAKIKTRSSVALADLDGDGYDEVIAGADDGTLHANNEDGSEVTGWPKTLDSAVWYAPAIGDLDNDGEPEIVAVSLTSVYAFKADGSLPAGWSSGGVYCEPYSSPVLADVDGDGLPEVIVGSYGTVTVLNHDGTPAGSNWPWFGDAVTGTAVGDIDGNGDMEIITGNDVGFLCAINPDGSYDFSFTPVEMEAFYSSPVLVDVDSDAKPEVVVCTTDVCAASSHVCAFNEDGTFVSGWPVQIDANVTTSPAIGDVDGDGKLDIVVVSNDGEVHCLTTAGQPTAGWQTPDLGVAAPQTAWYRQHSPLLADIDADYEMEVVMGWYDGDVYAFNRDGSPVRGWPRSAGGQLASAGAIGNMDSDILWDIVFACEDGAIYRWETAGYMSAGFFTAEINANSNLSALFPWTTFQGSNRRTGLTAILAQDAFERTPASGEGWSVADYGGTWSHVTYGTGDPCGQYWYVGMTGSQATISTDMPVVAVAGQTAADVDVVATLDPQSWPPPTGKGSVIARVSSYNTFYAATVDFTNHTFKLERSANGIKTTLATQTGIIAGYDVRVRLRVEGNTVKAKYMYGQAESAEWMLTATDANPLVPGKVGLMNGSVMAFSDFLASTIAK